VAAQEGDPGFVEAHERHERRIVASYEYEAEEQAEQGG